MNDPDFDPYLPPRAPVGLTKTPKGGGAEVPDGSPWVTIWTRPRGTIRGIVNSDPTTFVLPLAMLSGFGNGLTRLFKSQTVELPVAGLLVGSIIGGALGGFIGIYLMGFLVRMTGGWLGGRATAQEVRAALAWSSIPIVALLPIQLLTLAVYGADFFRADDPQNVGASKGPLLLVMAMAMIVLGFWSAFLNIKCVAEVHRFSAWKSLGTLLLVGVVFLGIVLLIVVIVVGLMAAMKAGG